MESFFTAVELNHIVLRYLLESGFVHAAFNLSHEARINESLIDGNSMIPIGTLFILMRRGLLSIEMEANLTDDDSDVDENYVLLKPMDLITKKMVELKAIVKNERRSNQVAGERQVNREAERVRRTGIETATSDRPKWNWGKKGRRGGQRRS
ncbi:hypothetical protein ACP275_08G054800 [Erythranthe tilingii]